MHLRHYAMQSDTLCLRLTVQFSSQRYVIDGRLQELTGQCNTSNNATISSGQSPEFLAVWWGNYTLSIGLYTAIGGQNLFFIGLSLSDA